MFRIFVHFMWYILSNHIKEQLIHTTWTLILPCSYASFKRLEKHMFFFSYARQYPRMIIQILRTQSDPTFDSIGIGQHVSIWITSRILHFKFHACRELQIKRLPSDQNWNILVYFYLNPYLSGLVRHLTLTFNTGSECIRRTLMKNVFVKYQCQFSTTINICFKRFESVNTMW